MPPPVSARAAVPVGSRGWWEARPEARFVLRFVALAVLAAVVWAALRPTWPVLEAATAQLVEWSSRLVGLRARADGASVAFGDGPFRYTITDGCTGLSLALLYGVAVVAYPATSRQHRVGLAVGVPLLFVLNLIRLVALGWVGDRAFAYYGDAHLLWGQLFSMAAVGVVWFGWVWSLRGDAAPFGRSPGASRRLGAAATFAGVFALLGVLGLRAHLVEAYGSVLATVAWALTAVFWPTIDYPRYAGDTLFDGYAMAYACVAATAAWCLAGPGLAGRARLRLLGVSVAAVVAASVVLQLMAQAVIISHAQHRVFAAHGTYEFAMSLLNTLNIAAPIGIVLTLWYRRVHADQEHARRRNTRTHRPGGHHNGTNGGPPTGEHPRERRSDQLLSGCRAQASTGHNCGHDR